MKERLAASAYFFGWWVVRSIPERAAYLIFSKLGDVLWRRNGKSVQRLRSNLSRTAPELNKFELDTLTKDALHSYMRYWCDTFRIQSWSRERILNSVTISNGNLLIDRIERGEGVVVALPHSGNWDLAGAYFCALGIPLVTVAERLKPEALFQRFLQHRTRMGFEVLALDNRSFATLLKRAREKRLIALVADRDLSQSGINVEFFGAPARMPAGPALLAVKTDIPLIVAHVSYTPHGIHIDFHDVKVPNSGSDDERIKQTVQACARLFEIGIREHPQDWHMLQRIWIDGDFVERVA
jgi:KDO2-lipid IV(A) lauroyltransferase